MWGLCQATLTVSKQKASFCHLQFVVLSVTKTRAAFCCFWRGAWVCMPVYAHEEIKIWQYICSFWGQHKLREIKISKWNEPKEECRGIAYQHLQFLQFRLKAKCGFWGKKMKTRTKSTGISRNSFLLFPLGGFSGPKWVLNLVTLSFIFGLPSLRTVSLLNCAAWKVFFFFGAGPAGERHFSSSVLWG